MYEYTVIYLFIYVTPKGDPSSDELPGVFWEEPSEGEQILSI